MCLCSKCGGEIVFRRYFRHWKTGRVYYPQKSRAFPIHLSGACGQLVFAFP